MMLAKSVQSLLFGMGCGGCGGEVICKKKFVQSFLNQSLDPPSPPPLHPIKNSWIPPGLITMRINLPSPGLLC